MSAGASSSELGSWEYRDQHREAPTLPPPSNEAEKYRDRALELRSQAARLMRDAEVFELLADLHEGSEP